MSSEIWTFLKENLIPRIGSATSCEYTKDKIVEAFKKQYNYIALLKYQ